MRFPLNAIVENDLGSLNFEIRISKSNILKIGRFKFEKTAVCSKVCVIVENREL